MRATEIRSGRPFTMRFARWDSRSRPLRARWPAGRLYSSRRVSSARREPAISRENGPSYCSRRPREANRPMWEAFATSRSSVRSTTTNPLPFSRNSRLNAARAPRTSFQSAPSRPRACLRAGAASRTRSVNGRSPVQGRPSRARVFTFAEASTRSRTSFSR